MIIGLIDIWITFILKIEHKKTCEKNTKLGLSGTKLGLWCLGGGVLDQPKLEVWLSLANKLFNAHINFDCYYYLPFKGHLFSIYIRILLMYFHHLNILVRYECELILNQNCQAQPKPQLAGLVLFPINPDKPPLILQISGRGSGEFIFQPICILSLPNLKNNLSIVSKFI